MRFIADRAFASSASANTAESTRSHLKYVELPPSLRYIGVGAFQQIRNLGADFELPEGLLAIGDEAFFKSWAEDNTVKSIRIPGSVAGIGQRAFSEFNTSIETFQFGNASSPSRLSHLGSTSFMADDPTGAIIFALTSDITISNVSLPENF